MRALGGQEGRITRRMLWGLLVAFVVASIVFLGVHMHMRSAALWKGFPPSTWDGVPAMLDAAVQSEQYRQGGEYLSDLGALEATDFAETTPFAHRVVVDFLRSLTPEQVNIIRRRVLTVNHLRRDQKEALLLLSLAGREDLKHLLEESGVFVSVDPGGFLFNWVMPVTRRTPDGTWTGFFLILSPDGATSELFDINWSYEDKERMIEYKQTR